MNPCQVVYLWKPHKSCFFSGTTFTGDGRYKNVHIVHFSLKKLVTWRKTASANNEHNSVQQPPLFLQPEHNMEKSRSKPNHRLSTVHSIKLDTKKHSRTTHSGSRMDGKINKTRKPRRHKFSKATLTAYADAEIPSQTCVRLQVEYESKNRESTGRPSPVCKGQYGVTTTLRRDEMKYIVSPALHTIIDVDFCLISDVEKAIAEYARENNLKQGASEEKIICDEILSNIFKSDTVPLKWNLTSLREKK